MPTRVFDVDLSSERLGIVSSCVQQCPTLPGPGGIRLRESLRRDLELIQRGRCQMAIDHLNEIIPGTQSPVAYLLLAEAYLRDGEPTLALATLDILSYVEPGFTEGALLRGLVECEHGTAADARTTLRAVVESRPSFLVAWKALIAVAIEQGAHQEAEQLRDKALQYHPCLAPESIHPTSAFLMFQRIA
jgi:hypothetical protein